MSSCPGEALLVSSTRTDGLPGLFCSCVVVVSGRLDVALDLPATTTVILTEQFMVAHT